jgi:outer membrane protein insertion porin family
MLGPARAQPEPPKSTSQAPAEAAREAEQGAGAQEIPELQPGASLGPLLGRPIDRVEIAVSGFSSGERIELHRVRAGEPLTPAVARRAARELLDTRAYASVSVEAVAVAGKVVLRLNAVSRRLVAGVRVEGGVLDDEAMLREAHIAVGQELTAESLPQMSDRARQFYVRHGYRSAKVDLDVRQTDDPMRLALVVRAEPGAPSRVRQRIFVRDGVLSLPPRALDEEIAELEKSYAVDAGDRVDEDPLTAADRALLERLRGAGYYRAAVAHQLVVAGAYTFLYVRVNSGPKFVFRFEGLHRFDAAQIETAIDVEHELDRSVRHLASKVADFYVRRGFLDAEVDAEERGKDADPVHVLYFRVRERRQVAVAQREFPCLSGGPLSTVDAQRDIDSFLVEELPGGGLLSAVDPARADAMTGSTEFTGTRPAPLELEPRTTYVAEIYDRALKHLQDYYRSQGYLSATVGPLEIVRRRCDPRSPPGQCRAMPLLEVRRNVCLYDAEGLPVEEPPPDPAWRCVPDPKKGIECEPRMTLRIPIKLGPRTTLYDLAFEGNKVLVERDLAKIADLTLGDPVSQTEIEAARRRVLDAFKEEGFAFAEIRALLDFSADRTRARARFVVSEGERVVVDDVVVRGAKRTEPGLIRKRVALAICPRDRPIESCEPYRASDVRKTEERVATLGAFSSVSVSLEDPYVPARRKVVIIDVEERVPQYLDLKGGFSTGEGFRGTLEYGHRNVWGEAIQLTLRVQLGYLPDAFILDDDVRENFDTLTVFDRLERRDTVSLLFPEIGLGPLFNVQFDGIDVRDNARDFGLTKEAAMGTLNFRPVRSFYMQAGVSLERNDVHTFRWDTVDAYLASVGRPIDLLRLLRVPDGLTFAFAQRLSATWDRRDNPFGATKGTLLQGSIEHVHAYPAADNPHTIKSDFVRLTGTLAGYVRLSQRGLAIAMSLKGGRIKQLTSDSKTYPDRLFFLGGVDSLRGFLQDSLVPEDVASQILHPNPNLPPDKQLTIEQVAIRGGDVFINPRMELRIPISGIFEGGVFLDTGNVWVEPKHFDPFVLRYTTGLGLRVGTPIGPIAFDYGYNLDRRPWEDSGNFHFSIGLF